MYFLLTVLLISLGVLIGITINSSVEKAEFWSAVSAFGSWISGIGALAAGFIALHISHKQDLRDTHKLRVLKSSSIPVDIGQAINNTQIVPTSKDINITIDIFNYGLRQVQIMEVIAVHAGTLIFSISPPPPLIIQPGTKESISIKPEHLTLSNQFARAGKTNRKEISTHDVYASDLYVIDAADIKHLAKSKNSM